MWFLAIGVVIFGWKWYELGPIYNWNWGDDWWVALPFILAVVWWSWADASGYTKRKAIEQDEALKKARVERNREKLKGGKR